MTLTGLRRRRVTNTASTARASNATPPIIPTTIAAIEPPLSDVDLAAITSSIVVVVVDVVVVFVDELGVILLHVFDVVEVVVLTAKQAPD